AQSGTSYSDGQGPNFTTSGGGGACNPATPTNLSVTNVGSEAVELSWNSNPSIDHYNIRYKKVVNTDWVYIYSISGTATSTVLSGVINNGTQYEWQIRAKCSDGSGSSYTDGQGPNFTPSSSSMVVYGSGIIGTSLSSIEPKLDVYPNPFTSDLTIQVQGVDDIQTTTLKMYSIDGSLVYEKSNLNSGSTIHLNLEIERGIYMLHWFDRDGNLLRSNKLIKSH
ncbi:MAG: T9SS type A sorting domain-containing protein, partial [Crocinitomicaceae bacterium]